MERRPAAAKKPSFMKILFGDFADNLLIPPKFVRLHGGTLTNKCILRLTGTQDSWTVTTKQKNNSLYFDEGWKEFAHHFSLQSYDFLVFRHVQDSEFNVDMFDKSCCRKEFVGSDNVSAKPSEPAAAASSDDDDQPFCEAANDHRVPPSQQRRTKRMYRTGKENPKTPASAPDTVEELMASSEFPTIQRVMKLAYSAYMPLPSDFVQKHMNDRIRQVKIDVSNKIWTVGALKHGCGLRLSSYWGLLARENALENGDLCIFQLINTADYTFKLTVFRKTKKGAKQTTGRGKGKAPPSPPRVTVDNITPSVKALRAAHSYSSLSKYLSHPFKMKPAYQEGHYLHVPSMFVKKMKAKAGANNAKLQCRGKEWKVTMNLIGSSCKINKGWTAFANANSVATSDAGVLELINAKDRVIKISLFGSDNINPQ